MIDGWSEFRGSGVHGAVAPGLEVPAGGAEGLAQALLDLRPGVAMRALPDRETFLVDRGEEGQGPRCLEVDGDALGLDPRPGGRRPWVVKRHRAGRGRSASAEALRELVAGAAPRSPGRREAENLAGLSALGLSVPAPLLWARAGGTSLVALEFVPHARTLRSALEGSGPRPGDLARLAAEVARMHAAGWYHRDLYLEHLLEAEDGLVLIDAGRARCDPHPRLRWLVKDLAALSSSAPAEADHLRLRFLARWRRALARAGRPLDARAVAAAVGRREARMRAHRPRHVHRALDPEVGER